MDRIPHLAADIVQIGPVRGDTGHVVTVGALDERIPGGAAVLAGAHGVLVVLDDVDDGKFPQGRKVEGFMEGALVHRAVAEVANGDLTGLVILLGEGNPGREGGLSPDDAVAAVKMLFLAEKVHRAALAAGATGDFAEKFGHTLPGAHSPGEGVAMIPVGGDDRIILVERGDGTDGNGLLADIEVAKTADLGLHESLGGLLLEPTDENHLAEQIHALGGCQGRQNRRGLARFLLRPRLFCSCRCHRVGSLGCADRESPEGVASNHGNMPEPRSFSIPR